MALELVRKEVKTFLYFWTAVSLFPLFCGSFVVSSIGRRLWIGLLNKMYGSSYTFCERTTIRTLVDTFRNQGIFNFILKVQGDINADMIRKKLMDNIIERRDKMGELCYPKLRLSLTTCWGSYAWIKESTFCLDDHLIFSNDTYKGRLIRESNVQEYISNIVSKYLPSKKPQWQFFVIPIAPQKKIISNSTVAASTSLDEMEQIASYYILLRVHHIILEEEPKLTIKDLLLLNNSESSAGSNHGAIIQRPLLNDLFGRSVHISKMQDIVTSSVANRWNEFTYYFDTTISCKENIRTDNVLQLFSICIIISVTAVHKFYYGFNAIQDSLLMRTKHFQTLMKEECSKRNLSWDVVYKIFAPAHAFKDVVNFWCWVSLTFLLTFPVKVYLEVSTITKYIINGTPMNPRTLSGLLYDYIPIGIGSLKEATFIMYSIYKAPVQICEELFEKHKYCDSHKLQKVSLCGRKVVAWSDTIEIERIKQLTTEHNVTDIELILSATCSSLHDFFNKMEEESCAPEHIDLGFTCFNANKLKGTAALYDDHYGMICLSLPVKTTSIKGQLATIRSSISKAQSSQLPNYLLSKYHRKYDLFTKALPSLYMRLLINYLARKYPIVLTQISNDTTNAGDLKTTWGDTVLDIMYFPPPQSNICISLIVQRSNGHIRLCIVADDQLSCYFNVITKQWKENFDAIANELCQ